MSSPWTDKQPTNVADKISIFFFCQGIIKARHQNSVLAIVFLAKILNPA